MDLAREAGWEGQASPASGSHCKSTVCNTRMVACICVGSVAIRKTFVIKRLGCGRDWQYTVIYKRPHRYGDLVGSASVWWQSCRGRLSVAAFADDHYCVSPSLLIFIDALQTVKELRIMRDKHPFITPRLGQVLLVTLLQRLANCQNHSPA